MTPPRVPPHSTESEQAVLGALMLSNESIEKLDLSAADFYRRDHQILFQTIKQLRDDGAPYDPVTIGEWIESNGKSGEIDPSYPSYLSSTTPSAANIAAYAEIVKQHALKRRLIEIGTEITNKGFNCAKPTDVTNTSIADLLLVNERATTEDLQPLDLFADHGFPNFNRDWLPPGVANYAWDQAAIIGMPPEMLAMGCLGTISAAMSDNFKVKVKRNENWFERSRLWIMVIAEPGSKKSLAIDRPMTPLHRIQADLSHAWQKNAADYEQASRVYAEMNRAAVKRKAKGEGHEELPEAPKKPANRVVMINNTTTEKLGELMLDNPRGIHWYSDELCVWFGQHDAYARGSGGVDRGMALTAYDGKPYRFDRVGRGTTIIPNFSYSLIGTTQPDKIKATVKGMSDDGLLQRFITVEMPHETLYGDSTRLPDASFALVWDSAIEMIWSWGRDDRGGTIHLSDEAEKIRDEFSRWITRVAGSAALPSAMRGHISKWEGMFPRLMLCYHAFGCAQAGIHIANREIAGSTAERVLKFMKGYMLPNAMRFYSSTVSNADPVYGLAKKIGAMILANKMQRITNRDLQRAFTAWRDAPEWQKKAVITLLKQSVWLTGDERGSDTGWMVVPAVHRLYAQRAEVERERRAETSATLRELREIASGNVSPA